jgi:hypothetical protein
MKLNKFASKEPITAFGNLFFIYNQHPWFCPTKRTGASQPEYTFNKHGNGRSFYTT